MNGVHDGNTIIDCPDCRGGGRKIEILCTHSLFGGYNEKEVRTGEDCRRCGGLGKLTVKLNEIKEFIEPDNKSLNLTSAAGRP